MAAGMEVACRPDDSTAAPPFVCNRGPLAPPAVEGHEAFAGPEAPAFGGSGTAAAWALQAPHIGVLRLSGWGLSGLRDASSWHIREHVRPSDAEEPRHSS